MEVRQRQDQIAKAQFGTPWSKIEPTRRLALLLDAVQQAARQLGKAMTPAEVEELGTPLDEMVSSGLGSLTDKEVLLALKWMTLGEVCDIPRTLTPAGMYAAIKAFAYCDDRQIIRQRRWASNGGLIDPDVPRKNFEALKDAAQQRWLSFLKTGHVEGTEPPQRVRTGAVEEVIGHTVFAKVSSLVYQWLIETGVLVPEDWEDVAPTVADPIRRDALRLEAAFIAIRDYGADFLGEVQKREFPIN